MNGTLTILIMTAAVASPVSNLRHYVHAGLLDSQCRRSVDISRGMVLSRVHVRSVVSLTRFQGSPSLEVEMSHYAVRKILTGVGWMAKAKHGGTLNNRRIGLMAGHLVRFKGV
jgi:hypothetical protein